MVSIVSIKWLTITILIATKCSLFYTTWEPKRIKQNLLDPTLEGQHSYEYTRKLSIINFTATANQHLQVKKFLLNEAHLNCYIIRPIQVILIVRKQSSENWGNKTNFVKSNKIIISYRIIKRKLDFEIHLHLHFLKKKQLLPSIMYTFLGHRKALLIWFWPRACVLTVCVCVCLCVWWKWVPGK